MQNHETTQISSGNVFADLGLENSDTMLKKAELVRQITEITNTKRLTPEQICQTLNISQDRLSALTRGKLCAFSLPQLLDYFVSVLQV